MLIILAYRPAIEEPLAKTCEQLSALPKMMAVTVV